MSLAGCLVALLLRLGLEQPSLVWASPAALDLGEVLEGEKLEAVVEITNGGSRAIRLVEAGPPCNHLLSGPVEISPGSTRPLTFSFAARRSERNLERVLSLTVEPGHDLLEIPIRARVLALPRAAPAALRLVPGAPQLLEIDSPEPFAIVGVHAPDGVETQLRLQPDEHRQRHRILLVSKPGANPGYRGAFELDIVMKGRRVRLSLPVSIISGA